MRGDSWADFERFDHANPEIWETFATTTKELIAAGERRFSQDFVMHIVRWQRGPRRRIRNAFVAFYARKFVAAFPELPAVFELKPSMADAGRPSPQMELDL